MIIRHIFPQVAVFRDLGKVQGMQQDFIVLYPLAEEAHIQIGLKLLEIVVSHLAVHKILKLHYLMFLFRDLIMLNDQEPNLSSLTIAGVPCLSYSSSR